jgi:hypothetical protein
MAPRKARMTTKSRTALEAMRQPDTSMPGWDVDTAGKFLQLSRTPKTKTKPKTKRKPRDQRLSLKAVMATWRDDPSKCHNQLQSPLFGILPAELQNRIYDLVFHPTIKHLSMEEVKEGVKSSRGFFSHSQDTSTPERFRYPSTPSTAFIEAALL